MPSTLALDFSAYILLELNFKVLRPSNVAQVTSSSLFIIVVS
jgi:hypothetical protein